MAQQHLITLTVGRSGNAGFFIAHAKLYDWKDLATALSDEIGAAVPILRSEGCEARDADRALSYALADLAAKISGGR